MGLERWLKVIRLRLRALFRRARFDQERDESRLAERYRASYKEPRVYFFCA